MCISKHKILIGLAAIPDKISEIEQNWRVLENFDISCCGLFDCF